MISPCYGDGWCYMTPSKTCANCFMRGEYDKACNPVKSFRVSSFVPEERQERGDTPGGNPERGPSANVARGQSGEGQDQAPRGGTSGGKKEEAKELFHGSPYFQTQVMVSDSTLAPTPRAIHCPISRPIWRDCSVSAHWTMTSRFTSPFWRNLTLILWSISCIVFLCFEPPPTPSCEGAGSESIPSTVADCCQDHPKQGEPCGPGARVHGVLSGGSPCPFPVEPRVQTIRYGGRWRNVRRVRSCNSECGGFWTHGSKCSGISRVSFRRVNRLEHVASDARALGGSLALKPIRAAFKSVQHGWGCGKHPRQLLLVLAVAHFANQASFLQSPFGFVGVPFNLSVACDNPPAIVKWMAASVYRTSHYFKGWQIHFAPPSFARIATLVTFCAGTHWYRPSMMI